MKHSFLLFSAACLLAASSFAQAPGKFTDPPAPLTPGQAFEAVRQFQPGQSRQPVNTATRLVQAATADPAARRAMAVRLAKMLDDPSTTPVARKLICHNWLPLVGDDDEVPALQRALARPGEEQIAIGAIARLPGTKASAALREAITHANPLVRAMAAEQCGFNKDPLAVPALAQAAAAGDATARRALGWIDTPEAQKALAALPPDAAKPHPIAAVVAASRGPDAMARLGEALKSPDGKVFATAVLLMEKSADPAAAATLGQALESAPTERKGLLLQAIVQRGGSGAQAAIQRLVETGAPELRAAALQALGEVGGVESIAHLAAIANGPDPVPATAARDSLVRLRGAAVAEALRKAALSGDAKSRAFYLSLLASRSDPSARDLSYQATADASPEVRRAGWNFLAEQPEASEYPRLLGLLAAATAPADIAGAERAAFRSGSLLNPPAARIQPLAEQLNRATGHAAASLVRLLGLFGGPEAAAPLRAAMGRAETRDAAVRALTAWTGPEVIDDLVGLAKSPDNPTWQALALRALQRLGASDKLPRADRVRALRAIPEVTREPGVIESARTMLAEMTPGARLESALPNGFTLAAYVDCGPETSSGGGQGPTLAIAGAQSYTFSAGAGVPAPVASVAYATTLQVQLGGLSPNRKYYLGFTWWDGDGGGRKLSVHAFKGGASQLVIPAVEPLAYLAGKPTWGQVLLPLDPAVTRVDFVKEAGPNAVLSEVWILEETTPATPARKRVALITGDEYPGHLWRQTAPELARILSADPRLEVTVIECGMFMASPLLDGFDGVVLNYKEQGGPNLPVDAWKNLQRFVESGRGLVLFHFACGAAQHWQDYEALVARVWDPKLRGHDPYGPMEVATVETHPITRGLGVIRTTDELYTCLRGDRKVEVIASAISTGDKKEYPMGLVHLPGKGRVFNCTLGHDLKAMESKGVRDLYRRAAAWSAGLTSEP